MLKFRADRRVSHNERRNTFLHPLTGQVPEENKKFDLKISALDMSNKAGGKRPTTTNSDLTNHSMVSEVPPERPSVRAARPSRKAIAFGKRSHSMKRNPSAPVTKAGWLFKQASSGVKQWNKRWFVLVDRCLFYYKDEKEESVLGSVPLLSFRVAAVQPSDNISRKHTFKVSGPSSPRLGGGWRHFSSSTRNAAGSGAAAFSSSGWWYWGRRQWPQDSVQAVARLTRGWPLVFAPRGACRDELQ
uniref:Pleckstrin homology domain containing A6 n=1 Tax=Ovis aries TaxID=9940 RepID=A0AC11CWG3_SHEEP